MCVREIVTVWDSLKIQFWGPRPNDRPQRSPKMTTVLQSEHIDQVYHATVLAKRHFDIKNMT